MSHKIEIPEEELLHVYKLLEDLNEFFHQPMNYENCESTIKFESENQIYKRINQAYYNYVWEWLPQEIKDKILAE